MMLMLISVEGSALMDQDLLSADSAAEESRQYGANEERAKTWVTITQSFKTSLKTSTI